MQINDALMVMPPFTEHRVARGEGSLYVRDYAGEEPAFVCMHGFPDNLHIYDDLVPFLVEGGRRVVTFDFLGFGASDKPSTIIYSFRQQLADLEAVVDALSLVTIIPVAHDSSGPAALNFAIGRPERTAGVVVLNAVYGEAPSVKYPEFIELFATKSLKALTLAILQSPEQFAWVLNFQRIKFQENLAAKHRARYAAFLGPVIDENFRSKPSSAPAFAQMTGELFEEAARNSARVSEMEALDAPVKLIWGETDPYLNIGVARDFKLHLKNAVLHELPAGHWVQIDEPRRVAELMLADF